MIPPKTIVRIRPERVEKSLMLQLTVETEGGGYLWRVERHGGTTARWEHRQVYICRSVANGSIVRFLANDIEPLGDE